ncbi:MAG: HyaD/HybD family hydrogenase maturation endopeptidase [bacterium]|nr:HyaD/HybD family hydrogenase maturation endopeptidase [bacterium]
MASATYTSRPSIKKTLIAGIGNILLGDEGVGVRVIEEMERRFTLPAGLSLLDGGTAGYALIDYMKGFDRLILIDAVRGGKKPGTIYRLNADDIQQRKDLQLSGHQISLPDVLLLAGKLDKLPEILLIGIEPRDMDYDLELSRDVKDAAGKVIELLAQELNISPSR